MQNAIGDDNVHQANAIWFRIESNPGRAPYQKAE